MNIILIICLTTAAICAIFTYVYNRKTGNFQREVDKRIKERRERVSREISESLKIKGACCGKDEKMD